MRNRTPELSPVEGQARRARKPRPLILATSAAALLSISLLAGNAHADQIFDSGTTNLNSANSYTGNTFIRSTSANGVLNANVTNALPNSTDANPNNRTILTMGDGTSSASFTTTLNLNGGVGQAVQELISGNTATGTQAVVNLNGNTLTIGNNNADVQSFYGTITGTGGSLIKDGNSTQILGGANTYTGATTVNGGTLAVIGSLVAASTVNVNSGGTLSGTGTASGTVNILSGGHLAPGSAGNPGTLDVGTLVLNSGANSDFRLAQAGTTGMGVNDLVNVTGNLTLGGNLNITQLSGFTTGSYTLYTYGSSESGSFSAINGLSGYNATIVTGVPNQVSLTVSPGVNVQYWDGSSTTATGSIAGGSGTWDNTTTNWTNATGSANAAWASGTAVFNAPGGTVTLGAPISAQGLIFGTTGYTINGGSNALTLTGTTPTIGVTNAGDSATIGAPISGSAGLAVNGSGTLVLTNASNNYTGTTSISVATLQIGGGSTPGSIGSGPVSISNGGYLNLINNAGSNLANNISNGVGGTGTVQVQSANALTPLTLSGVLSDGAAGTLGLFLSESYGTTTTTILTNTNTYSGSTVVGGQINYGSTRLVVNGSLAAASTVYVSGTVAGTGTIGGTVNVQSGGHIQAGDPTLMTPTPGTLTVGNLNLNYNSGANADFRLAQPGVTGSGVNDLINVTGNLTMGGNLNITQLAGFTAGSYTLFTYGGTETGSFATINGLPGYNATIVTGVPNQVSLTVTGSGNAQYWDGSSTTATGSIAGGSGTWDNTTTNWTNATGSANAAWASGTAVFNAPGGTVTLGAPISAQGLIFGTTGYTINGGSNALTLTGTTPTIGVTNAGDSATIGAPISGSAGLAVNGSGTLVLTNASNNYTGTTSISVATLQIGGGSTPGSIGSGPVSISNGGYLNLINNAGSNLANNISNGVGGTGTVQVQSANALTPLTLSGVLSDGAAGTLGLFLSESYGTTTTTILTNTNTYSGSTVVGGQINYGSTRLVVNGSLAAASTVYVSGTVAGTGTIGGTVNVQSGGHIQAGDPTLMTPTPGTLTVGNLNLNYNSGANADFRLAQPGVTGSGVNDLINVTGNLTMGGNLNITQLAGFTAGSYTLFTYGGTETGSFATINGLPGYNATIVTGVPNQVSLTVTGSGNAQYWDGSSTTATGSIAGGSGTWDNTTTNWTNATGSANAAWASGTAVFNAPGGTVTLGAPISAQGLIFGTTGYTINGGSNALTLTGTTPTIGVTNAGDSATIGAPISGSAGLAVNGSGTLVLTNASNNYTGTTSISVATLQIGGGSTPGSIGSGPVSISNGGYLNLINNAGSNLANNISNGVGGTGTVQVQSANALTPLTLSGVLSDGAAGTLGLFLSESYGTTTTTILTNTNTYSGSTVVGGQINYGSTRLVVNGSLAAASTVYVSGTVAGTGTIGGTVNVQSGGHIQAGDPTLMTPTPGTLTVGNLNLNYNSGANADFRLAQPGVTGSGVNDLINVTGNLTMGGNLNITQLAGFTAGSYTLFTYGGTETGSFATINGLPGYNATIVTGVPNQVSLTVSIGSSNPQYWDSSNTTPIGSIQGGSGTWDNATTNWTNSTGTANSSWQGGTAVFNAPGGTVTLGAPVSAQGLIFGASGYTVNSPSFALTLTGATPTISVNATDTATINAPIAGSNGLTLSGAGTLVLTGTNTYTGPTNVNAGFLQVGNGTSGNLTGTSGVTVAINAVLNTNLANGSTFSPNINLNGFNATLETLQSGTNTFSGAISGSGEFVVDSPGITILSGNNNLTGLFNIAAASTGTLRAGSTSAFGSNSQVLVAFPGNKLDLNGFSNTIGELRGGVGTFVDNTSTTPATLTTGGDNNGTTYDGVIQNSGGGALSLVKAGTGTFTLTGANSYTGTTAVNGGTLAVNGSLAAASTVTINSGATLSGTGTVSGTVNILSGGHIAPGSPTTPGTLNVGTLALNSGANSDFRLAQAGVTGGGVNDLVHVTNNLTLGGNLNITQLSGFTTGSYTLYTYGGSESGAFSSINGLPGGDTGMIVTGVAGQVSLVVSSTGGAGTQFWDGASTTATGSIQGGTGTWDNSTTNWTNSTGTVNSSWQNGTAVFGAPGGTVTLGAPISAQALIFGSTGYVINGPSFALTLTGTTPAISVTNAGNVATINAQIAGSAGLTKNGAGVLILAGVDTYTGQTTVNAGILNVQNGSALGSTVSTVVNAGATLQIQGGIAVGNVPLMLNGTGATGQTGALVNVSGTNSFGGPITLGSASTISSDAGTLNLTNAGAIAGGNKALTLAGAGNGNVGSGIQGTVSSLTKNGAGTWILSGLNTYTGPTTVNAGKLQAGSTSAFGNGSAVSLTTAGATLDLNGFNNTIGALSGVAGSVVDNTSGTAATLTTFGNNTTTTFNGVIKNSGGGALALTINLPTNGTQIITGANSYTGLTTVTAGTLQIGDGATTGTTIASSGTVQLGGAATLAINLSDGSTFANSVSSINPLCSLNAIQSGTNTLSGAISGTGSLNQIGTGTTIFTGTSTYTGATNVNAGTLQVGDGTNGNLTGTSGVTVANNATLATNLPDGIAFHVNVNLNGANAAFNAIQSGTNTISGVISGTGTFNQNGTGTTILTNTNTYTGATTVNAGILEVNGSIASATTTVNSLGTLQGLGTLGGHLFNSGTVSPGSTSGGPGTLKVSGNYTQNSSGNLRVGLASTSTYGRLQVTGAANLNGTITAVSVNGFHPQVGNNFQVVTANGGVNGTFSSLSDQTGATGTLVTAKVTYNSTTATLQYVQGPIPIPPGPHPQPVPSPSPTPGPTPVVGPSLPFTPNGLVVAKVINGDLNDPRFAAILAFLDRQPLSALPALLDRISPEELSSLVNATTSLSNVQGQNIQGRLGALQTGTSGFTAQALHIAGSGPYYAGGFDGSPGLAGPNGDDGKEVQAPAIYNPRLGTFLTGEGEWVNVGNTDNARGYDLVTGGFTLGVDYKFTPNLAVGINAGYAHTGADLENGGRSTIDAGKFGLYGTYFTGGFYVDAAVSGGYNSYSSQRGGLQGTARGDTDGGELDTLFGTGYDWHMGGLSFGPTANFQYTYTETNGFTEHGSLAPMSFPSQSVDSIRSAVGLKATYDWKVGSVVIRPELATAWQHEYGENTPGVITQFANGAGSQFTVFGPEYGRDSLLLRGGFAVFWNDRASSYVYYDGEFARTNYDSSTVSGGVRITF